MDMLRRRCLVALPLLLPGPAEANSGVQMLVVVLPELVLLLIPTVYAF